MFQTGSVYSARRRSIAAATGALFLVAAAWLAGSHSVVGDSYCGSAFYDSYRNGACGRRLALLGTLALLSLIVGISALVLAWLAGRPPGDRLRALPVIVLGLVALGLGLVAAHNLLEPSRQRWCGSVVNRHRTYEPVIERECDRILRPNARAALLASLGSAVAIGAGIALRPRRRPDASATAPLSAGRHTLGGRVAERDE